MYLSLACHSLYYVHVYEEWHYVVNKRNYANLNLLWYRLEAGSFWFSAYRFSSYIYTFCFHTWVKCMKTRCCHSILWPSSDFEVVYSCLAKEKHHSVYIMRKSIMYFVRLCTYWKKFCLSGNLDDWDKFMIEFIKCSHQCKVFESLELSTCNFWPSSVNWNFRVVMWLSVIREVTSVNSWQ